MKKTFSRILAALLALAFISFAACSNKPEPSGGDTATPAPGANTAAPKTNAPSGEEPNTTPDQGSENAAPSADGRKLLFKSKEKPVAACENRFIVRNETGNLYALVDESGNYVLPLEYGAMSFEKAKRGWVVKAMNKGSYGVFDMDGNNIIPCEYSEIILDEYFDCCIVKDFADKCGAIGLDGKVIVEVDSYSCRFNRKYPVEIGESLYYYDKAGSFPTIISPDGSIKSNGSISAVCSDLVVLDKFIIYKDSKSLLLMAKNTENGETQSILDLESCGIDYIESGQLYSVEYSDVKSASPHIVIFFKCPRAGLLLDCSIKNGEPAICNLNQLLYRTDHPELPPDYVRSKTNGFYEGKRLIIERTDIHAIYVVDVNGERTRTINETYSDPDKCFVIEGAAILYRNGYYFAIDYDENPILSNAGYTEVERIQIGTDVFLGEVLAGSKDYDIRRRKNNEKLQGTGGVTFPICLEGLFLLTDPTGEKLLINDRAEEIIPLGKVTDAESAVMEVPSNERNGLEAKHEPNDILRVLHATDNTWGVYSAQKHGMIVDFIPFEDGSMGLYNCLMGNGGYVLESDDESTLFTVEDTGDGFEVCLFAQM